MFRRNISATLLAEKMAMRNASFQDRGRRGKLAGKPMSLTWAKTVAMSQVHLAWVEGGHSIKRTLIKRETKGCSPTEGEDEGSNKEEIADLCTPIVLQERWRTWNR